MEADRNVKVIGDVAVLWVGRGQVATLYYPLNACDESSCSSVFDTEMATFTFEQ